MPAMTSMLDDESSVVAWTAAAAAESKGRVHEVENARPVISDAALMMASATARSVLLTYICCFSCSSKIKRTVPGTAVVNGH